MASFSNGAVNFLNNPLKSKLLKNIYIYFYLYLYLFLFIFYIYFNYK